MHSVVDTQMSSHRHIYKLLLGCRAKRQEFPSNYFVQARAFSAVVGQRDR